MKNFMVSVMVAFLILGKSAVASSLLEEAVIETKAHLTRGAIGEKLSCFPMIKGDSEAFVIYSYGSWAKKIDKNMGHNAPRLIEVEVKKTDKPALLVLSGYEPIVWKLKMMPGASVAGVYLTGYYEQRVLGLPKNVPVGRSMARRRDGSGRDVCSVAAMLNQNIKKPFIVKKTISREDYRALLKVLKKMDGDIETIGIRLQSLEDLNKMFVAENVSEKARSLTQQSMTGLKGQISAIRTEQASLQKRFGFAGLTQKEISKKISRMRYSRRSRRKANYFSKLHLLQNSKEVEIFEKELAAVSPVRVVSYQTHDAKDAPPVFIVSSEKAKLFRDTKEDGKKRLAELKAIPPKLILKDKDAPVMAAPTGYINSTGLNYLVKQGYLEVGGNGLRYYQKKCAAFAMSKGGRVRKRQCYLQRKVYTLLGPIVYPKGLCGGNSAAFLRPKGVAKPKGKGCHSVVINLEDDPCLGGASKCHQRGRSYLGLKF